MYTVGLIKSDKGYGCVGYVSLILIKPFKLFSAIYVTCGHFEQEFSKLPFSCKEFVIYNNNQTNYLSWWFVHSSFIVSKHEVRGICIGFYSSFDCFPSISKHICKI